MILNNIFGDKMLLFENQGLKKNSEIKFKCLKILILMEWKNFHMDGGQNLTLDCQK